MTNQLPGFYARPRRRANGKVVTYYFMDRRAEGLPELSLGSDYERAMAKYRELRHDVPSIAGTIEEAFQAWERDELPGFKAVTRADYTKWLRHLRPVFGPATWDGVALVDLRGYLDKRSGKVQANREVGLLGMIWRWAQLKGYTELPWPAAGLQRAKWKNRERPRTHVPSEEVVAAIYAEADPVLRDCMDLAQATGMRLTDCRTVLLPRGDLLHLEASKTGKTADFDLSLSSVLPDLIARRRALRATHLMLLSTPAGKPVSARMLRDRYDEARATAAKKAADAGDTLLADAIRKAWLRDMRKVAGRHLTLAERSELFQHGDTRVTARHYPGAAPVLKPAK